MSDVGGQKSEVGGQTTDVGSQRSDFSVVCLPVSVFCRLLSIARANRVGSRSVVRNIAPYMTLLPGPVLGALGEPPIG